MEGVDRVPDSGYKERVPDPGYEEDLNSDHEVSD
jgi:hypothetical protein